MTEKEKLTNSDCIKTAILVLESMTAKDLSYEQQLLMVCGMLEILKSSYPDLNKYTELEAMVRKLAGAEVSNLFGV